MPNNEIDREGYVTFQQYPLLKDIISFVDSQKITAPAHLTRFNGYLLHERSKRFWQREQWRIRTPVVYLSNIPKPRTLYVIPSFFVTDCASVPVAPLIYYMFGRVGRRAATIHDFLYRNGTLPRLVADRVFREALYASNTFFVKTEIMFTTVVLAGAFSMRDWEGCLDYYKCKGPRHTNCHTCKSFYPPQYLSGIGEFSNAQLEMPAAGYYFL